VKDLLEGKSLMISTSGSDSIERRSAGPYESRDATKATWFEPYRQGLLLALFADDNKAIEKLLEWPETDLPVDASPRQLDDGQSMGTEMTIGSLGDHLLLARSWAWMYPLYSPGAGSYSELVPAVTHPPGADWFSMAVTRSR
jgi:hypothetical protein